jgi:hypothetical protein
VAVQLGHLDVEEDDVGPFAAAGGQGLLAVAASITR